MIFAFLSGIFCGFVVFMVYDSIREASLKAEEAKETVVLGEDEYVPLSHVPSSRPMSQDEWDRWIASIQGGSHASPVKEEEREHRHQ